MLRTAFYLTLVLGIVDIAEPVHASLVTGLYGIDVSGNFFKINVATGAGTAVGILPFFGELDLPGYNEIEYDHLTKRTWAQLRDGNFAALEIGVGVPIPNGHSWHAMEYVGSTLYAAGFAGPNFSGAPHLATLDPSTGASTGIGPTFTAPITGLAYDIVGGVMYGIETGGGGASSLHTIDLSTGAATLVGTTTMSAGSLAFGPDGNLYAGGTGGISSAGNLYRINTATAASTLVGPTGFGGERNGISGLTLVTPEPSSLAIFGLGACIAGLGYTGRRKRMAG